MSIEVLSAIELIQSDSDLCAAMSNQAEIITEQTVFGVFRANACCQNAPHHNCELNINS